MNRTRTLSASDDLLGERYKVASSSVLGEGAFGAVMLATDMKDAKRTQYAIKKVPIDNMAQPPPAPVACPLG